MIGDHRNVSIITNRWTLLETIVIPVNTNSDAEHTKISLFKRIEARVLFLFL